MNSVSIARTRLHPSRRTAPPAPLRAGLLLAALMAACSSGGGGATEEPHSTVDPRIDEFIGQQQDLPAPVERDENTLQSTAQEGNLSIATYRRVYTQAGQEYPVLAPHGDVIYPGSDVQGASLVEGIPAPITAPRGPGSIAITSATGSALSSVTVPEVSMASVSTAMNQILAAQPQQFPANLTVSIQRVRTGEEIQISLGANASYLGVFNAAARFSFDSRTNNTAMLVAVRQTFYTMAFERPSLPSAFYAPGVTLEQIAQQIGPGNPPAYVSEVEYGSVFYLLVQSTADEETVRATLEANINLGVAGGGVRGGVDYLTMLQNVSVQAYAYGGSLANVRQTILGGLASWQTLRNSLLSGADLGLALPTAYTVRSLATDAVVKNDVNADYTYQVVSSLGSPIPTLLSPANQAVLDNGCGVTANQVNWTFDWNDVPGADRYRIEITNNVGGVFAQYETANSQDSHSSVGALRPTGWSWRVRARIGGAWQGWSGARNFTLEAPNTDCTTGVRLYSHPNYQGSSIWIAVTPSRLANGFDLEALGFDDDMDSFRLYNLESVDFYQDPLRAPWNGGVMQSYGASSANVGSFANRASAGRFHLGFSF